MSDQLIKSLEKISDIRYNASKECSKIFCEAMGNKDLLNKNWPPKEGQIIVSDDEMDKDTYHALETEMPWFIFDEVPEDMLTKDEKSGMRFVNLDFAAKNGFLTKRIMSPRFAGDIDSMAADEKKAQDLLQGILDTLFDEVKKYEDVTHISNLDIYAHMEGKMLSVFVACIVASRPTEDQMKQIKMQELQGRLMALLKSLPPLREGEAPNPKNWEWTFTKEDAQLAVDMLKSMNPGTDVIASTNDLLKMPFMGISVKNVDAKETSVQVKLDLGPK